MHKLLMGMAFATILAGGGLVGQADAQEIPEIAATFQARSVPPGSHEQVCARVQKIAGVAEANCRGSRINFRVRPGATVSTTELTAAVAAVIPDATISKRNFQVYGTFDIVFSEAHDPAGDATLLAALQAVRFTQVELLGPRRFRLVARPGNPFGMGNLMQRYCRSVGCPNRRFDFDAMVAEIVFHGIPAAR
jgi:hypothetical protein